jgi:hypothetical protein
MEYFFSIGDRVVITPDEEHGMIFGVDEAAHSKGTVKDIRYQSNGDHYYLISADRYAPDTFFSYHPKNVRPLICNNKYGAQYLMRR